MVQHGMTSILHSRSMHSHCEERLILFNGVDFICITSKCDIGRLLIATSWIKKGPQYNSEYKIKTMEREEDTTDDSQPMKNACMV